MKIVKTNQKSQIKPKYDFIDVISYLIAVPIYVIVVVYKIFFQFPSYRSWKSHLFGLIRLCFWGYWLLVPDHKELFHNWFTSEQWQLSWPFFSVITFVMAVQGLIVFLGYSMNGIHATTEMLHDDPAESNIEFTLRQLNWKLHSRSARERFLDKFLG